MTAEMAGLQSIMWPPMARASRVDAATQSPLTEKSAFRGIAPESHPGNAPPLIAVAR